MIPVHEDLAAQKVRVEERSLILVSGHPARHRSSRLSGETATLPCVSHQRAIPALSDLSRWRRPGQRGVQDHATPPAARKPLLGLIRLEAPRAMVLLPHRSRRLVRKDQGLHPKRSRGHRGKPRSRKASSLRERSRREARGSTDSLARLLLEGLAGTALTRRHSPVVMEMMRTGAPDRRHAESSSVTTPVPGVMLTG